MTDYLWDKEGADPEVQALEQQLGTFAYDADPPTLPSTPAHRTPPPVPRPFARPGAPWKYPAVMPGLLGAGLVLMGFAVAWVAMNRERSDVRAGWNLAPIVVASRDLGVGTLLSVDQLEQRSVPQRYIPDTAVSPDAAKFFLGQRLRVPLSTGDALLWTQLEHTDAMQGLAAKWARQATSLAFSLAGVDRSLVQPDEVKVLEGDPNSPEARALVQKLITRARAQKQAKAIERIRSQRGP